METNKLRVFYGAWWYTDTNLMEENLAIFWYLFEIGNDMGSLGLLAPTVFHGPWLF